MGLTEAIMANAFRDGGNYLPLYSKNLGLFAYINKDLNIWIRDINSHINFRISKQGTGNNNLYTGTGVWLDHWSRDGRFLVYLVTEDMCDESIEICNNNLKPNPDIKAGFYVADLFSGKVYYLPSLEMPGLFIPNTHKLLNGNGYDYSLNFDTFENYQSFLPEGMIQEKLGFSDDMQFLTYYSDSLNIANADYSKIMLVNLTKKSSKTIAEGKFADFQNPLISRDGKWLAYNKHSLISDNTYIYNINQGKVAHTFPGYPYRWTYDNKLVLTTDKNSLDIFGYYLMNPDNWATKMIFRYDSKTFKILE